MAGHVDLKKSLDYFVKHFKTDPKPCKEVRYNCAVRVSLALNAGGFTISDFKEPKRVHNGGSNRSHDWDKTITDASTVPHLVAAEELFEHLQKHFPNHSPVRATRGSTARQQIACRKGVVFFENCFTRKGQSSKRGDHIDVWDGSRYGNEVIGIDAAGNKSSREDLFARAEKVFFFAL